MSLLEIKDLAIDFSMEDGKIFKAVDGVSFSMNAGEFVALVGESGSGKTMTCLSIMNLLPENARCSGSIQFSGKNKSIIFQEPMTSLNPLIKVGKQIMESGIENGMSKNDARKKAEELALLIGLKDIKRIFNSYPHELSGGMRQRVMIASALMTDPQLLIADEPTTALDVSTQNEIIQLIYDLNKKLGTSLLLITHDFTVVKRMCKKIYVMYKGKIVEEGDSEKIFFNPQHPYTKALLESIPAPSKRGQRLPTYYEEDNFGEK